jgi:nucleoside-diphosphate-sugar epimerase
MELPQDKISVRSSYNVAGIDFTPKEIADEIRKHIPEFQITYKPDFRQAIADSWPQSIDDSYARANNGWKHEFDLAKMTEVMLGEIKKKLS